MVSLTIDGKTTTVPKGATILEAARKLGISIPTLCWLEKVSPTGACRICAVEIEGIDRPMTACNTPVKEGIVVTTDTEALRAIRRQVVELLLVNHPLDCPVCDAGGECDLQNICYDLDVDKQPFEAEDVNPGPIDKWPLIQQVPSRCILCEKCVKVCHEVVGSSSLFVNDQGDRAFIDKDLELCEFCGSCVGVCPTGTMISKPFKFKARPWELAKTPSVCTYCGSQCQIDIHVKQGEIARVTSEDGETVNDGTLCIGGFFGYGYVNAPERLRTPQMKKEGKLQPVSWEEALSAAAEGLSGAGGAAVAGLASPRLTNEENYLFQKLFRTVLGCNNIDSEARLGALPAALALHQAFGLQGASNRIANIAAADAVLVFGGDPTAEAPAIDWAIEKACRKGDGKLLLANLRRVKLNRFANSFLNYRPGSEAWVANALAKMILEQGLADEDYLARYVSNLDELRDHLGQIDLQRAVQISGVPQEQLEEAARMLGEAGSVAVVFGGDLARSSGGDRKALAVANLALVAGALHGEAGGLFPVDEKGNVQGVIDTGVCPELLPGYQDYAAGRKAFEKAWGVSLPEGGADAEEILAGIEQGRIKALYLAACNPLRSFPDAARWRQALQKLDLLVVQEILPNEVTALADVVLPGASFAEKSGTVTSLDNRVGPLRSALKPVGESRPDLEIFADLYQRLGGTQPCSLEAVQQELLTLTGIYSDLCLTAGPERGRACPKLPFSPEEKSLTYLSAEGGEKVGEGMQLLCGKILFQFGTTSTHASGTLEVAPEGYVMIHPDDAQKHGIADGTAVKVTSKAGSATGKALVRNEVPQGLIFAPHHFSDLKVYEVVTEGNLAGVQLAKG